MIKYYSCDWLLDGTMRKKTFFKDKHDQILWNVDKLATTDRCP